MSEFVGIDQNCIRRVWGETVGECAKAAHDYENERPDIRLRIVDKHTAELLIKAHCWRAK